MNHYFDDNAFNHVFNSMRDEHRERTGEVEEVYEEPQEQGATGVIEYSDFEKEQNNIFQFDQQAAYHEQSFRGPKNPQSYDRGFIKQCQQQPNITQVQPMKKSEALSKVNSYRQQLY